MAKCGVCQKRAGSSTFLCIGCNQWTHPPCEGYTKKRCKQLIAALSTARSARRQGWSSKNSPCMWNVRNLKGTI